MAITGGEWPPEGPHHGDARDEGEARADQEGVVHALGADRL